MRQWGSSNAARAARSGPLALARKSAIAIHYLGDAHFSPGREIAHRPLGAHAPPVARAYAHMSQFACSALEFVRAPRHLALSDSNSSVASEREQTSCGSWWVRGQLTGREKGARGQSLRSVSGRRSNLWPRSRCITATRRPSRAAGRSAGRRVSRTSARSRLGFTTTSLGASSSWVSLALVERLWASQVGGKS